MNAEIFTRLENQKIVELIIERGSNVNHADMRGITALFKAAFEGNEDSIRIM